MGGYAGLMRIVWAAIACASALAAQSTQETTRTTSVDVNGNRVWDGAEFTQIKTPNGSETVEKLKSINGGMVQAQRVEEHVIRNDSSEKIIERVVRNYDQNGDPLPPVKTLIDEHKQPNGSSTVETTTSSADVNGNTHVIERTRTDNRVSGATTTTNTVVERPTLNGGFGTVEKSTTVTDKRANGFSSAETVYREDPNGGFYTAVRRTTDHTENGSQSTDNSAEYEVGPTGALELHGQTITHTAKRADGSEAVQVDIYRKNVPGVSNDTGALKLQEQQDITRKPGPGNSMVETVNVRRPSISDPNSLGPERQLSQTTCQGNCKN